MASFFMKYTEALDYINRISMLKGSVFGLDSIRELCSRLGNPQDELSFVHVAGTNGKGSTLAFISEILVCSGYKVGRYISPTIRDYRERFQINGRVISMKKLGEYMETVKNVCDSMVEAGLQQPTAFEIETAIGFLYFRDSGCDIVALETGMGGISDATNIVSTTVLSVLASISMDHMQFLGDTLEKIAHEKCGIIKHGVPVVTGFQKDDARKVIETECDASQSKLYYIEPEDITNTSYKGNRQTFTFNHKKYETGLMGVWQNENGAIAVKAAQVLANECGYSRITDESIKKGIATAIWPARFQKLSSKPLLIIDGAHNEDAALRLRQTIDLLYSDKKKIYIMGMFRDKAVDKVVETMVSDGEMVFTCQTPNNPRALTAVELAEKVRKYNENVTSCDSIEEAIEFAFGIWKEEYVIIACGSLAYLGKIIDIFDIK